MKKIYSLLLLMLMTSNVSFSQTRDEPGNNIGKSLSVMKREFPDLRYIKTDTKGDMYEDGYPEDGIAVFFYFKNNSVVEECMIVQSNDDFSRMWYNSTKDAFIKNFYTSFSVIKYNECHWCYSSFQVHLIYDVVKGTNTAMIVYEDGGYKTGITYADFVRIYR